MLSFGFDSNTCRNVLACVLSLIFSVPLNTRQEGYSCQTVGQKDLSKYRTKNEEKIVTWDLVHHSSTPKEPIAVGTSVEKTRTAIKHLIFKLQF